ncbi:MAG: D-aminoacyl-tRNA deacylase, partial [Muribaculaceae bacterium]|nr:D-aminoacyl-tRNA deacylase [Muribaculaceae bacterium]
MRLVIQRVKQASVTVAPDYFRRIDGGLMVLVGIENGDTPDDVAWLVKKTIDLRIFNDDQGVMNRSVLDTGGAILAISQFTLLASTR